MGIRSELEESFDLDIVDEFLDHFSLMSDSMEIIILDLNNPAMYRRSLDELFRIFHNIKSASGFLKITSMHKLSSFVEDALDIMRSSDKSITQETIDWLLLISDMYSQWNSDFSNDTSLSKINFKLLKLPDLDK
jgi:two-component system chemotaxis sensor kinase CheA